MEQENPVEETPVETPEQVGDGVTTEEQLEEFFYEYRDEKIPVKTEDLVKFVAARDPELAELVKSDKRAAKLAVDLLGKDRRSDDKYRTADRMIKQAEEIAKLIQNPKQLFNHPNEEIRNMMKQVAIEQLQEWAAEEEMSPEQKRIHELETIARQYEEEKRYRAQTEAQRRYQEELEAYAEKIIPMIDKAIQENEIDAPYETAVGQISWYMDKAAEEGINLTPSEAAKLYKEDLQAVKIKTLPKDKAKILELLGDEGKELVRQALLEEAKGRTAPKTPSQQSTPQKSKSKPLSVDEFRELQEKRISAYFGGENS